MHSKPPINDGFNREYASFMNRFSEEVGESAVHYGAASHNIREELVRCLWFGSHFSPEELRTDDQRRIEILSPGWWNVESGPDFKRAEMLLEGAGRVVGDVEIHTRAPGWYAHKHHTQPEYNNVCLHVVMWDAKDSRPIRRQDGETVPQLTLSRFLDEEIDELIDIVDLEGGNDHPPDSSLSMGRFCGQAINSGDIKPAWLGALLDCAGDQRIISRTERLIDEMEANPPEEVLYRRIADALGYKNNRMGFRQLASTLPVSRLHDIVPVDASRPRKRRTMEASFYGVGGFLDEDPKESDRETMDYVNDLREIWSQLPSDIHRHKMTKAHWDFGGTRPANFPTRRIAALAGVYAGFVPDGLLGHLARSARSVEAHGRRRLDTTLRDALMGVFTQLEHPYWSHRFSFGGKKMDRAHALVGQQRAKAILIDVLIPTLLARGRYDSDQKLLDRINSVWDRLPRQKGNMIVHRMQGVMFGNNSVAKDVIDSARRQQGLHQIHKDFCDGTDGCESCIVYLAHEAGEDFS